MSARTGNRGERRHQAPTCFSRRPGLARMETLERRDLLSTYSVNTTSNLLNPGPGLVSLRQAVAGANANAGADTINFDPAVFPPGQLHTINLNGSPLKLTDTSGPTAIIGPGSTALMVDGANLNRVFVIDAGVTVAMSKLTVTHGLAPFKDASYNGGGIYNQGALTLQNVTVASNIAMGDGELFHIGSALGAGIYSTGQLAIQSSTFRSNKATGYGPMMFMGINPVRPAFGGAIYAAGALTLNNCTITANSASGSSLMIGTDGSLGGGAAAGGGVWAASTLSVTQCTLSGNTANGGSGGPGSGFSGNALGGAIYSASTTSLVSTTLTGNKAVGGFSGYGINGGGYGGGICTETASLTITSSNVSFNQAISGTDSTPKATASAAGGGIFASADLTLTQSTVSGNTAAGGNAYYSRAFGSNAMGGGIFADAATVSASTISGNAAVAGAGIFGQYNSPSYASAGGKASGGALWCRSSTTLTNSTLADNHVIGGKGGSTTVDGAPHNTPAGNGGDAAGGAVYAATGDSLTLLDSAVTGNTATAGIGGLGYMGPVPNHDSAPGKPGAATAGGIFSQFGKPTLFNTIASANMAGNAFNDGGPLNANSSHDLVGFGTGLINGVNGNKVGVSDPKLAPLGNFGGPTKTMAPVAGSPAIDAGSNALVPAGLTTDQRGLPRIVNGIVDIGAVEFSKFPIAGKVYNDVNGGGGMPAGAPGLARWTVYVDLADRGFYVTGDPFAVTDSHGNYTLTLSPITVNGPLIVREIRLSGWRRTNPPGPFPLGYYSLSTSAGSASNINFGNSQTALVVGAVYIDTNQDGRRQPGEAGLTGWTIVVDLWNGRTFVTSNISTATDSKGNYHLVLPSGRYRIREIPMTRYRPTSPGASGHALTLGDGETLAGVDFGNV